MRGKYPAGRGATFLAMTCHAGLRTLLDGVGSAFPPLPSGVTCHIAQIRLKLVGGCFTCAFVRRAEHSAPVLPRLFQWGRRVCHDPRVEMNQNGAVMVAGRRGGPRSRISVHVLQALSGRYRTTASGESREAHLPRSSQRTSSGARAERMWVIIDRIESDRFFGVLDRDRGITDIEAGDPVEFDARHIIQTSIKDPVPDPTAQ